MGTLSIIKTTKGMRFGGYTEQYWNGGGENAIITLKDAKNICFYFSLDLFKIYNFNDNSSNSIFGSYDYGPYLIGSGNVFIYIYNNNDSLIGNTNYQTKDNSFDKFDYDYEINNGQSRFSVVELEVFQILFDN